MTEKQKINTFQQIIPIINLKPKNNKDRETYDSVSLKRVLLNQEELFLVYQKEGKTDLLPTKALERLLGCI